MPNATLRANARTLPENAKAAPEGSLSMDASSRAHARWLKALAQLEFPDSEDDEFVKATFTEERAALRELFLAPAACAEEVWVKLAAFEGELVRDQVVGQAKDSLLFFGLGSIKADLMNLGIKEGSI